MVVNIPAILAVNGSALALLLILMVNNFHSTFRFTRSEDKVLFSMFVINTLQCVLEPLTFLLDGPAFAALRPLCLVFNTLLYVNTVLFSLAWVVYADLRLFGDVNRLRRRSVLFLVPMLLVVVGALVNLFVPVFFQITPMNEYSRLPLVVFPYIISYAFMIHGAALIYHRRKTAGRYMFLPALLFLTPAAIASMVQAACYGVSILWMGSAIGLTSLYINMQKEMSCIDPLSGLFNRQYMLQYLRLAVRQPGRRTDGRKMVAGILMDVDRFKSINDSFGHLMGDDAIRHIGEILHSCLTSGDLAVRYAGDEFVMILTISDETEVTNRIESIRRATEQFNATADKPYALAFSFGYSLYGDVGDTLDAFLGRMDNEMYAQKRQNQAAVHENG